MPKLKAKSRRVAPGVWVGVVRCGILVVWESQYTGSPERAVQLAREYIADRGAR
jgi:hypothetical protein